jgi:hypothetical protein
VTGALTSSLSISELVAGDAGNYDVVVSGGCGSPITTNAVTLTLDPDGTAPDVTAPPDEVVAQTLCQ